MLSSEARGRVVDLMAAKEGWQGRFFEDFEVGDVYRHPLGRTVTETDNVWFTLLTQNTAPVHFDRHSAAQTGAGRGGSPPPSVPPPSPKPHPPPPPPATTPPRPSSAGRWWTRRSRWR